ncbi:MAG: sensor domain-containing diguanylate cyclase [Marinobacter sp.]|uniref:sensor domain-containing diguanylate cyclase n=1 Tax=Marinobacter sp. TaxID=50741 RepID=UPI003C62E863
MNTLKNRHIPLLRTLWVVLIYLCVGWLWITFSDAVAHAWFTDPTTLSRVQAWKGLLFVLVTTTVLFVVLLRQLQKDRRLLQLQHRQREALRRRERQLTVLMDNLPGMAYCCRFDEHWTMLFVSSGCRDLTGYEPDELVENRVASYASLIGEEHSEGLTEAVSKAVEQGEPFAVEYALTRKDGSQIWVWERGRGVDDEHEGEMLLEGIVLDISDRKALENELAELATLDPLTGLYNRREMTRLLEEEIARASRYRRELALLWIDFDHFKVINDSFGHAAGDAVLRNVSERMRTGIRSVDVIGRFGGEEFVILLPEMGVEDALETAERLRLLVGGRPVPLETGDAATLTISIGVAAFPMHGHSPDSLCAAADRAMYRAKEAGRNCVIMAPSPEPAHNA